MTFIELLLAAKGGSKSAFEELFGRYKNLLRKYSVINGINKQRKVSATVEVWRLFFVMPNANSQYDEQENFVQIGGKA